MNLVIDQGNTICKVAVYIEDELCSVRTLPRFCKQTLLELMGESPSISSAIYSSVGEQDDRIIELLSAHIPMVVELGAGTSVPIEIRYNRSGLGSDRLAAAVGAYALAGGIGEHLVIDAGTAITYERVSASGCYLGGNISPGLHARLRAMHEFTNRLPLLEDVQRCEGFGQDTVSAMECGALLGLLYEIEGYISAFRIDHPEGRVFLTGGDADLLGQKLSCELEIVPDLVLYGLNYILEYNKHAKENNYL
ncbi:MAG: type III pantothenate kinase [Porphyromonadaceae bacterium]|nr:type III pantothenate kinase [Porphyromonadaceae bacterium]